MLLRGKLTIVVGANLVEKHSDGSFTILRRIGEPVKSTPGMVLRRKK